MVVFVDPSMMMSARVAAWLARLDPDVPVAAAHDSIYGEAADLGLFAGTGPWRYRRRLWALPEPREFSAPPATAELIRTCAAARADVPPDALPGARQPRDGVVAAQLWAAMVGGAWVLARRTPLWELLTSAGVELRFRPAYTSVPDTSQSGARADLWPDPAWRQPMTALLGPVHSASLVRRTRFFARALDPDIAARALTALGDFRPELAEDGFVGAIIEVFDAGPPSSELWR